MQESLVLFESVINSRWFLRTSVILFLNKIDVFKQKLPKVPLVHYFPEYTGALRSLYTPPSQALFPSLADTQLYNSTTLQPCNSTLYNPTTPLRLS